ncbi:hypothetical protein BDV98DRAFT_608639 [Pterulicium gracile]|uniref:Zn(2)-C6 fungal-type domain-containing protein n=1 Tax=Pterulicium gracile TaxID=1884261 RepID=A0A5C3QBW0_9AGAR|nr:hypothetical protein BDV98DRAFT_608639 [Pterula gracilis]
MPTPQRNIRNPNPCTRCRQHHIRCVMQDSGVCRKCARMKAPCIFSSDFAATEETSQPPASTSPSLSRSSSASATTERSQYLGRPPTARHAPYPATTRRSGSFDLDADQGRSYTHSPNMGHPSRRSSPSSSVGSSSSFIGNQRHSWGYEDARAGDSAGHRLTGYSVHDQTHPVPAFEDQGLYPFDLRSSPPTLPSTQLGQGSWQSGYSSTSPPSHAGAWSVPASTQAQGHQRWNAGEQRGGRSTLPAAGSSDFEWLPPMSRQQPPPRHDTQADDSLLLPPPESYYGRQDYSSMFPYLPQSRESTLNALMNNDTSFFSPHVSHVQPFLGAVFV